MASTPSFIGTPRNIVLALTNATGTTLTTIYTAPANGARIDSITLTSTDTTSRDIQFYVTKSAGTATLIGTISAATLAGTTSSNPAINVLASANLTLPEYDAYGNKVLVLEGASVLSAQMVTTITSGKTITILGQGGEF